MTSDLHNKVALVTGASRGIGRGIALELAAAGCDLLLTARDRDALEATAQSARSLGRRAEIHGADLRGDGEPARLASLAKDHFDRLDILVNNAGANRRGDFFVLTDADWAAGFDLKFFAQVRLCRAAWPLLKKSSGSIVAIAGIGGVPLAVVPPAIVLAIAATSAAPYVIERMTDHGYRQWTRVIIFAVSTVYLIRGAMLYWNG